MVISDLRLADMIYVCPYNVRREIGVKILFLCHIFSGVVQSSKNSLEHWNKQVLHVWSANNDITNTLIKVYSHLSHEVVSNTVVLITTTNQSSNFIFKNKWTCVNHELTSFRTSFSWTNCLWYVLVTIGLQNIPCAIMNKSLSSIKIKDSHYFQ